MDSCLSTRKRSPQSDLPTSSTATHDPSSPAVSAISSTSPGCTSQRRLREGTTGAGDQLQHVPVPLTSTDENGEMGISQHDPQTPIIHDPSPDYAGRREAKERPSKPCDELHFVSPSPGATDKNEEVGINIVQHSAQAPPISNPSSGDAEQGQGGEGAPRVSEQPQRVASGSTAENEEIVITAIRAKDVALGLGRFPAGIYIILRHNNFEWRTENKPLSVNSNVVEWSGPIPISSDLSVVICLEVYASFEFQPMLGDGEQLRKLTVTVGELLERSGRNASFTSSPKDGDIVSPCLAILVTVKRQRYERNDASGSKVVGLRWSIPEPRGEVEDATNEGHSALTRYRKHSEKRDLERCIEQFERALNACPGDDPRRAAAKSNLATAKLVLSHEEGTDGLLEAAILLYRDALAARPVGHPDRPLTLLQLASAPLARFARFQGARNGVDETNAKGLIQEVIKLSATESYERQAAAALLQLWAGDKEDRVESDGQSSMEDSTANLTDENPWILSVWLLKQFERFGDLRDLQQATTILEGLVKSTSICDSKCSVALGNLGAALSYRFKHLGELSDLEGAISTQREAARLTPSDHPDKSGHLNGLGNSLLIRFERLGELSDLEDAISTMREAVHLSPHSHPHKLVCLNNLGNSFGTRFLHLGELSDLDDTISSHREVVCLSPRGHPDKPMYLSNLGNSLLTRFVHLGEPGDLEDAISTTREAVHLSPHDHPQKPGYLNNLGNSFLNRFGHLGELSDLKDAISTMKEAVRLSPHGRPHKPMYLANLGSSFLTRFERLGELSDLEGAISAMREAVHLAPHGHPQKPGYLSNLGNSFGTRFNRLGDLNDIEEAISTHREAVYLTHDGHPDKPIRLYNLGNSFRARFARLGELSDLEDSISTLRAAIHLSPHGHPASPTLLDSLASSLQTRFWRLGEFNDLEDAISMMREAVALTPHGHPHKPGCLSSLGIFFRTRFLRLGELSDLEDAVSMTREAVHLTPHGHPQKPGYLHNLGNSFRIRFLRNGELSDLEDAISTMREAVHLTPRSHPVEPGYLYDLGISLLVRFWRLGEPSDLEDAILTMKEAVRLIPRDHPEKPNIVDSLAMSFTARFLRLGQVGDIEHAISLSSHVASIPVGPPGVRFSSVLHWIQSARLISHSSLLHAYSVAVNLLPKLAWIGLSLSHRYDDLIQSANVVREAAAAALDAGFPQTALEWLEQGRSVIWGDLFHLRSSYDELSSAHPDYASRLHALSTQLDQASAAHEQSLSTLPEQSQSAMHPTTESLQQVADKHRALAIERDKLLQEIRRLPGFGKFLLRKSFSQLRDAARSGPVVVLNVAKTRGDALIIVGGVDHVIHVPLPDFTLERCANLEVIMKGFVRDTRVGKPGRLEGVSWDHILSPLWKSIVKPVLDALALSVVPGKPSRIFWCPTGPLAFLPIHAAGFYDGRFSDGRYSEPGHNTFDFVVSSYVPTLSSLLFSPEPNATLPSGVLRLLLVPQPPSDGQAKLPGVALELRRINSVVSRSPLACITSEPSEGTVEEVLGLMKDADWVHFACHGVQDGVDSGLCLADGHRLKLRDIVALSRPRGGLAFLSACQTAKGDERLSDEAIHIAAGMLFAGYGGVVGTMWSISDEVAPRVAKRVYEELLGKGPRADYREAARALHKATGDLRKQGVPFDEWVPFIHVGL